jgi:hypothetical protein
VIGLLRRLLDVHLEWVDEVERELAPAKERRAVAGKAGGQRR